MKKYYLTDNNNTKFGNFRKLTFNKWLKKIDKRKEMLDQSKV